MSVNDLESIHSRPGFRTGVLLLLSLGMTLALAGNVYQFVRGEHMARDMALMQRNLQTQITKLSDATSGAFEVTQERFEAVKKLEVDAAEALRNTRSEARRTNSQTANRLEQENRDLEQTNQELRSQLADLRRDTSAGLQSASARLQNTSARLDTTSAKLNQVSAQTEKNGLDLKRVVGDLGVMSGNIATNAKEFAALRDLGDRAYFEFDLVKTKAPTRIADIQIAIRKTDTKRNLYTMDLYADDQVVQKRDRTINEPVQLYVNGGRQLYEIVVNRVKKNEVSGYLATPKARIPGGRTAGVTPSAGATPETARR
ncbi:MAG TPA: hypothetical protein VEV17_07920 [Bryobacteraceae bacterium]|nr:hypothetical protein [Bryobacteraceae bacterium]